MNNIFLLFLTLVPLSLEALPLPWYHNYFHKLDGSRYRINCSLINMAQKIRELALLAYYHTTHTKTDVNPALASIQDQLKEFETWLLELEQEALIAIKKKYALSDEIWRKCLQDIEQVKKSYRNAMMHPRDEAVHDSAVPSDIIELLTTLLHNNTINPKSINIVMISDPEKIKANPKTIAQTTLHMYLSKKDATNGFLINPEYTPAIIEIFPQMVDKSTEEKISLLAHEIQHLVLLHGIVELVLLEYLSHHCSVDRTTFQASEEYHRLSQIHEAQAEICAAIKSPHIAHCLKAMRKESYYPKNLYEEHFYHLSTVDMLWKVHAQLESFLT